MTVGKVIRGPWLPRREHDDEDGRYAAVTFFVVLPLMGLGWVELLTWLAGDSWPL